jgi:hypothetical protein
MKSVMTPSKVERSGFHKARDEQADPRVPGLVTALPLRRTYLPAQAIHKRSRRWTWATQTCERYGAFNPRCAAVPLNFTALLGQIQP